MVAHILFWVGIGTYLLACVASIGRRHAKPAFIALPFAMFVGAMVAHYLGI